MNCFSCGAALLPGTTLCRTCGTPVPNTSLPSSPYESMEPVTYPVESIPYKEFNATSQSGTLTAPSSHAPGGEQTPQLADYSPTAAEPQLSPQYQLAVPIALTTSPAPAQRSSRRVGILYTIIAILFLSNVGILYFALFYQPAQMHREEVSFAQTAETRASATVYASTPQGLYARYTSGKPELKDPLNDAPTSIWPAIIGNDDRNICEFTSGSYHIINTDTNHFFYCYPSFNRQSNFVLQVQMTIIKGDCGVVTVRADTVIGSLYRFLICPNGTFRFDRYRNSSAANSLLLAAGYISSMHEGLGQANLITVIAQNSHFYLYVNKQYVISADDSMYNTGVIGIGADDISQPTEVAYNNAEVWELS